MDPVTAYLEYLREMSRKIAYRGSFLNVLYRKPRRAPDRYLSLDIPHQGDELQRYLVGVEQDRRMEDGRKLFVGIGLIAGRLSQEVVGTRSRSSINAAAPLLMVPTDVESPEDTGASYAFEPDWNAITVNYELVNAVLERRDMIDPDDSLPIDRMLSPGVATVIDQLENSLEEICGSSGSEHKFASPEYLKTQMDRLRRDIPAFRELVRDPTPPSAFKKESLRSYVEQDGLTWFNHRFLFMGTMPDSLSAYDALQVLRERQRAPA